MTYSRTRIYCDLIIDQAITNCNTFLNNKTCNRARFGEYCIRAAEYLCKVANIIIPKRNHTWMMNTICMEQLREAEGLA